MEFEHAGFNFRAEKLSAIEQFHLSRKIGPLVPPLAPVIVKYIGTGEQLSTKVLEIAELAEPFMEALAGLSDEHAEQILDLALKRVMVQTKGGIWAPLWNVGAKIASEMALNDFGKLLPIVVKVIMFNLGNFIDGLLMQPGEESPTSNGARSPAARTG